MPKGVYKHKSLSPLQKKRIGQAVHKLWVKKRKGKSYEEIFGRQKASEIRFKMSLAKMGRKMPWNKIKPSGPKSARWIKDRTKIVGRHTRSFHDPCYRQWRKDVFARDKSQCRLRDSSCKGRIEAHHIVPWHTQLSLRYQTNNGICLCHAHHPRKRAEEKRLEKLFIKLASVSK